MDLFDSINPYETLTFVTGDSPEALVSALKAHRTPIKIIAIVPYGNRHVAYIVGDIRPVTTKKSKSSSKGS